VKQVKRIGVIGNTTKENIGDIITQLLQHCIEFNIEVVLCESLQQYVSDEIKTNGIFKNSSLLCGTGDVIVSIGGDGTMLSSSFTALRFATPIIGVNYGKLGFLAEIETSQLRELVRALATGDYTIEERMVLSGIVKGSEQRLHAINDLVIERGIYPKMIELNISVDDAPVCSFMADGLILSTPTGSTGYSLSVGGPVVMPDAGVITLSPISAHSLTMRPLIISQHHKVSVSIPLMPETIQINCDGQRVKTYPTPATIEIEIAKESVQLIKLRESHYFETLRKKLFWGIDARKVR